MMLNIFAKKQPSGRVEVTQVIPEVVVEDKEQIFSKAVRSAALYDLKAQIKYQLDCIAYGKERVDHTIEASKLSYSSNLTVDEIQSKYPSAINTMGRGFDLGSAHSVLAKALAERWINENYNKVAK